MDSFVDHLWLIPAFPLAAAAVGSFTRRGPWAAAAALIGIVASLVLSCVGLRLALANPAVHLHSAAFRWFEVGGHLMRIGWLLDPLTAFMAVMVSLVGTLIFIFSLGYMRGDPAFARFFCFLSLFASAMLALLISNSLLGLFVGWELVGLASYLLIGFWYERPEAAAAAKKAFITTRIGDLGLFFGMLWLYHSSGTLLFYDGGAGCLEASFGAGSAIPTILGGLAVPTAMSLLLFCGAVGKSGQFPLHVWLPDAMEGPSPVSALIHAATMVAAGVFLVARVYPLMSADLVMPSLPVHALTVVATVGAITALLGASIAVAQTDLKRILAFSTVSQLGYMMLALGVGSWVAAIFHLLTHAFFKALLFLGAGSVIHSTHHQQDIRKLGGLGPRMRATFLTFAIGMMALSGVPFLFSGFWSKEAILHAAGAWGGPRFPLIAGLAGVFLTAFYMTRLVCEVFLGKPRSEAAQKAHESPGVMTFPLWILALFSIGLGLVGTPTWPWLQSKLEGLPLASHGFLEGGGLMLGSVLLVGVGIAAGWAMYGRSPRQSASSPDPLEQKAPALFAFLASRMKFDEAYAATIGRLARALAIFSDSLDRWVISGAVTLLARVAQLGGFIGSDVDERGLNEGFNAVSAELRASGSVYSRAQTGQTQGYLRVIVVAFVVFALLLILGGVL